MPKHIAHVSFFMICDTQEKAAELSVKLLDNACLVLCEGKKHKPVVEWTGGGNYHPEGNPCRDCDDDE